MHLRSYIYQVIITISYEIFFRFEFGDKPSNIDFGITLSAAGCKTRISQSCVIVAKWISQDDEIRIYQDKNQNIFQESTSPGFQVKPPRIKRKTGPGPARPVTEFEKLGRARPASNSGGSVSCNSHVASRENFLHTLHVGVRDTTRLPFQVPLRNITYHHVMWCVIT